MGVVRARQIIDEMEHLWRLLYLRPPATGPGGLALRDVRHIISASENPRD